MLPPELKAWRENLQEFDLKGQHISFVYFLCGEGSVLYVGQSYNVSARIQGHIGASKIPFDQSFYLVVPEIDVSRVEKAFIRALQPPFNKMGVTQPPSAPDWEVLSNIGEYVRRAEEHKQALSIDILKEEIKDEDEELP